MFCSIKSNNLVNKVLERALRLAYKGNENNFQILLNENNETLILQRNLQFLMTEIYKIKDNYAPPIMQQLFQFRENTFHLRKITELVTHYKKTSSKVEHCLFGLDCHLNIKTQHEKNKPKQPENMPSVGFKAICIIWGRVVD